jgi:MSHA biogenesis protein MshK
MYKAGSPSAFINGQAVQIGDTVDGAKVIAITRRAVKLERNGKRFTLEISRG